MKGKPSLDQFRSGGSDEATPLVPPPPPSPPPSAAPTAPAPIAGSSHEHDARVRDTKANKTIRLRQAFEVKLKSEAFHRTVAEGRRVTESDIIDEALELYFRGR